MITRRRSPIVLVFVIVLAAGLSGWAQNAKPIAVSTTIQDAYTAATSGGNSGCVYLPPGTYTTTEIVFTGGLKPCLYGAGSDLVTIIPTATNQRLFRCQNYASLNSSRCDNAYIGGFTIKAHASGSTTEALNTSGFRFGKFFDIEFATNGTGTYNPFVKISGANLSHENTFEFSMLAQANASGTLVKWVGNGVDTTGNPNANTVYAKIYGNVGDFTAFDSVESAHTVYYLVCEANGGSGHTATCVKPGTADEFYGPYFEPPSAGVQVFIAPENRVVSGVPIGASNDVKFFGGYYSGGMTLDLTGFYNWLAIVGNHSSVTLNNGTHNQVIDGAVFLNSAYFPGGVYAGIGANVYSSPGDISAARTATTGSIWFSQTSQASLDFNLSNSSKFTFGGGGVVLPSLSASGQITSTVSTGTAPLVISSTTQVTNLNADTLDGFHAGNASTGKVMCWKDSTHMGYCSSAVDANGNCTCN